MNLNLDPVTEKFIVEIILKSIIPDKVYIIGYRDKYNERLNIFHGHEITGFPNDIVHIDLLIISHLGREDITGKIAFALKDLVNAAVLLVEPELFATYLSKGIHLAWRTEKYGQLIFERKSMNGEAPNYSQSNSWKYEADKLVFHTYKMANEFISCAGRYQEGRKDVKNLSIYFLRQAFELFLRVAILRVLEIELKEENNIRRLLQIAQWALPELDTLFDLRIEKDRESLKLLEDAIDRVFYNRRFVLERDELQFTRDKVKGLRKALVAKLDLRTDYRNNQIGS